MIIVLMCCDRNQTGERGELLRELRGEGHVQYNQCESNKQ
jgi:hypothetical protein